MIVETIMKTDVYTLQPHNRVGDAVKLMRENKIRHLPIVNENNEVVGIVTDHDIKTALPSCLLEESSSKIYDSLIEDIMVKTPITGHPLDFVEEIAVTFYESKISCMPIVSAGQLVGIITTTDLLDRYIELTGSNIPGSKLDIRISNKPGMLHEITGIIAKHKANVQSVLVFPDENEDTRILSVRLQVINPLPIIKELKQEGYEVLWPHLPGVTE